MVFHLRFRPPSVKIIFLEKNNSFPMVGEIAKERPYLNFEAQSLRLLNLRYGLAFRLRFRPPLGSVFFPWLGHARHQASSDTATAIVAAPSAEEASTVPGKRKLISWICKNCSVLSFKLFCKGHVNTHTIKFGEIGQRGLRQGSCR